MLIRTHQNPWRQTPRPVCLWIPAHRKLNPRGKQTCRKSRMAVASWWFEVPWMAFRRSIPLRKRLSSQAKIAATPHQVAGTAGCMLARSVSAQLEPLLCMKPLVSTIQPRVKKVEAAMSKWSCLQSSSCQTGATRSPFSQQKSHSSGFESMMLEQPNVPPATNSGATSMSMLHVLQALQAGCTRQRAKERSRYLRVDKAAAMKMSERELL